MRTTGPPIKVTKRHTKEGDDGGKILVVECGQAIFADHIENNDSAKKKLTVKDKIRRLAGVLFFMHSDAITANDCGIIVRLCPGADPDQVERAIRRVIAAHYRWAISRPDPNSEETFWRGESPTR